MKLVLIIFEFLLIFSTVNSACTGYLMEDEFEKRERVQQHLVYNYINRSLFMIILFKILFAFKKVEL